jgi:hypothetical protein
MCSQIHLFSSCEWFATDSTLQNWKNESGNRGQWFFVWKYFASLWFFCKNLENMLNNSKIYIFSEKDCHFWVKKRKEKKLWKSHQSWDNMDMVLNPRMKGSVHMLSYGIIYHSAYNSSYSRQPQLRLLCHPQSFRLVDFCLQSKLTMLLFRY